MEKKILNPRNSFLYLRNYFLNPRNNFLNPGNDFLIGAPNPETIYKTRFAVTNPNHWTRIPFNHLKSRDCPAQKNHLTKREKLPGWLLVQAFFILFRSMFIDSPSQNQALLCFYFSVSFYTISQSMSIFVSILSCLMV